MSNAAPILSNDATNNAKYVSIIPENQQTFSPGQKIVFNLEPSLGYIKARDSYLVFDILNNATSPLRLTLAHAGISSIIKQVNIYSKQSGILLETLDNYNQWVHTEAQYRFDDHNNLSDIEGFPSNISSQSMVSSGPTLLPTDYLNTYGAASNNKLTPMLATGVIVPTSVRFCTPLRAGIFRHWDDERLDDRGDDIDEL